MDPDSGSNLLMDPIEELTQVLSINSFGLAPSPTTQIILDSSFPINDEDKLRVAEETVRSGKINDKVQARAKVGLLEGDVLEVVLDKRGYTVSPYLPLPRYPFLVRRLVKLTRLVGLGDYYYLEAVPFNNI